MARPVRARIYYQIEEKICERGDYLINDKRIPGYRNYFYKSAMWLTWKLPRSTMALISSVRKWTWRHPGITYDQCKMDLEKRRQDHFADYTLNNKKIKNYDRFHGQESTIFTQIQNKTGPSEIYVFFDDGREVKIKRDKPNRVLKKLQQILN
jgi:hypothetical protein